MTKTTFTIVGNQEDPQGNPIPYTRTTQGQKWHPRYRRYVAWKRHVVEAYKLAILNGNTVTASQYKIMASDDKPMQGTHHGRVTVDIAFRDETHSDPDNVVKGILDSLFKNDKHIDVTTNHTCGNARGSVKVQIELV